VYAVVGTVCLLDISFVVDYSSTIRDTNEDGVDKWQFVIEFMVNVVRSIDVAPDRTHVAAVSFGMFMILLGTFRGFFIFLFT